MADKDDYKECFSHLSSAYGTDIPMEIYCRVNNMQTMCQACCSARKEFPTFGRPTHLWANERAMVERVNVENMSVRYNLPAIRKLVEEWEGNCHSRKCEDAIKVISKGYEQIELVIIDKKNKDLENQEKEKKEAFIG